jgi:hypothetical protein
MSNKHSQIYRTALGGYAVESTFARRARVLAAINAVFHWMGA